MFWPVAVAAPSIMQKASHGCLQRILFLRTQIVAAS